MKVHTLDCEMLVTKSLAETFAVFEDAHNLARITPSWLSFQVTTPGLIVMRQGAEITYKIKWLGFPMRWKTFISQYEPPFLFVDEQEKGPYKLWRHRHIFRPNAEGTLVTDHVEYALPLGPLGGLAHSVMVRRQLLAIFRYRQKALQNLFGGATREIAEPTASS